MNRVVRFLIFGGYTAAALAIVYGFFMMDWRQTGEIRRGYDFVQLTIQEFDIRLQMIERELSPDLLSDFGEEAIFDLVRRYWSTIGIFYVLFLAVSYGLNGIGAFVVFLMGRPIYPHNPVWAAFAILRAIIGAVFMLALPLFVMYTFYNTFLSEQTVGDGFWITLAGVISGGIVNPTLQFARLFVPHPATQPQQIARPKRQTPFDTSEITPDYFQDDDSRYDPYAENNSHGGRPEDIFPQGRVDDPRDRRRRRR